jgi:hypothetical protein
MFCNNVPPREIKDHFKRCVIDDGFADQNNLKKLTCLLNTKVELCTGQCVRFHIIFFHLDYTHRLSNAMKASSTHTAGRQEERERT